MQQVYIKIRIDLLASLSQIIQLSISQHAYLSEVFGESIVNYSLLLLENKTLNPSQIINHCIQY